MRVQRWIAMTMVMAACGVALAHESPVDHVHRILRMSAQRLDENDLVVVSYRMVLPERAALLQLKAMDQAEQHHQDKMRLEQAKLAPDRPPTTSELIQSARRIRDVVGGPASE